MGGDDGSGPTDDWVTVGRVVKPHGVRGELVVELLSDVEDRLAAGTEVRVAGALSSVVGVRPHQGRLLLRLAGVEGREAAERLRREALEAAPLDVEEFEHLFAHELLGLEVVDVDGVGLGRVAALVELPSGASYDLLEVVREDGSRWLLPAADDLVVLEERPDGLVLRLVDPPEGLVEASVVPPAPR